jgi:hypothetical protein
MLQSELPLLWDHIRSQTLSWKISWFTKTIHGPTLLEGCYLTDCHSSLQSTKSKLKTYPFPYSAAHLMLTVLGRIGVSLQGLVMLTGLGGRLGSTPGLFVGIGLGSWTSFPLTATLTFGGNSSETSLFGSSVRGKKRSCICEEIIIFWFISILGNGRSFRQS